MNEISVYEVEASKDLIIESEYSPCTIEELLHDLVALSTTFQESPEEGKYRNAELFGLKNGELYALHNEYVSEESINKEVENLVKFLSNLKMRVDYNKNLVEFEFTDQESRLLSSILSYLYFRCQHRRNVLKVLTYTNALNFSTELIFNVGTGIEQLVHTPLTIDDVILFHLKTFFMADKVFFNVDSEEFYNKLRGSSFSMGTRKSSLNLDIYTAIRNNYRISTTPSMYIDKLSKEYIFSSNRLLKSSPVKLNKKKNTNGYYVLTLDFDSKIQANLADMVINIHSYGKNNVLLSVSAGDYRIGIKNSRYHVRLKFHTEDDYYSSNLTRYVTPIEKSKGDCRWSECVTVLCNNTADGDLKFVEANPQLFFDYNYTINGQVEASFSNIDDAMKMGYKFIVDIDIISETYTFPNTLSNKMIIPMLSIYESNGTRLHDISGNVLDNVVIMIDHNRLSKLYKDDCIDDIVTELIKYMLEFEEYSTSVGPNAYSSSNEMYLAVSSVTAFFKSRVDVSSIKPISIF